VVSGPGLLTLHEYLRDVARVAVPAELPPELVSDDPAATLTNAALARACPLAVRTVDLFLQLYGTEAGNLALKMMSLGGLYVGGGIAPKLLPKLQEPTFLQAFLAKGRMRRVVESMPVKVVLRDGTGLLGAARHAALEAGLLAG
jgi:glucokinase